MYKSATPIKLNQGVGNVTGEQGFVEVNWFHYNYNGLQP